MTNSQEIKRELSAEAKRMAAEEANDRFQIRIGNPDHKTTKAQKISELFLIELAATGSITQAFDRVIGEGAYDKLAHEVYTELRAKSN